MLLAICECEWTRFLFYFLACYTPFGVTGRELELSPWTNHQQLGAQYYAHGYPSSILAPLVAISTPSNLLSIAGLKICFRSPTD